MKGEIEREIRETGCELPPVRRTATAEVAPAARAVKEKESYGGRKEREGEVRVSSCKLSEREKFGGYGCRVGSG